MFDTITIDCKTIQQDFQKWNNQLTDKGIDITCPVLYYLSFENSHDSQKILNAAIPAKKKAKRTALPKINHNSTSTILYVGKTNSNFPSRFRYHLGLVESKTYALHLQYWVCEWQFTLHFAKFCLEIGKLKYLEQLESTLHYSLKPFVRKIRLLKIKVCGFENIAGKNIAGVN